MTRALPIVVAVVLAIYALIDCLQTDRSRLTTLNRPAWLAIIVLVPVIGPILWLIFGRPRATPRPRPAATRPAAPDDDPEFLRQLRDIDDEHQKMLRQWESDLRRREDEMRRRADGDDDPR